MSLGHVDEIVLIVFEPDSCSFLELLWVIDINKIVVLHLLMAWVACIVLRPCLVVKRIRRTFAFDAGDSELTGLCFAAFADLVALARLFDVCLRRLSLCSMAARSHLGHFER